jgi:hypothetical protein
MTNTDWTELKRLAEAATPGDLDTCNDPPDEYGGKDPSGWLECPACGGDGEVEGVTYCNFDHVAMGVQFFGIGNEFINYEKFFRAANPAVILALLSERDELAGEVERLRIDLGKYMKEDFALRARNEELSEALKEAHVLTASLLGDMTRIGSGFVTGKDRVAEFVEQTKGVFEALRNARTGEGGDDV